MTNWQSMPEDFCTTEVVDRTLVVTMNRPDKLNALIPESHGQMASIFRQFEQDGDLDVAILTGAGRGFCVGSDISAYVAGTSKPLPPEGGGGLTYFAGRTKPVIAAVNGLCMGGGFEIALSCDLIIASSDAVFALPEAKVGAGALGGGMIQLARKVPPSIAMSLALTGDRLSADDALRHGLVSELVEPGGVRDAAVALAGRISANAPLAVAASRKVIDMAIKGVPTEEIWRAEDEIRERIMGSDDFSEGMKAFMEKRPAKWSGR
jgi:enoyl-CoA hydratase/carnithine racemase